MAKHIPGKYIPQKTRPKKTFQRPKNERPFHSCKAAMKKFFRKPNKANFQNYAKALEKVSEINPSQANAFKAFFKKEMFNRALNEKNFK